MKQVIYVVFLLVLQACIACMFGYELRSSNPEGIWLYTPPADGSGSPSDAFDVGFSIGVYFVSLAYIAVSISIYAWAKLKQVPLSFMFVPLATSSLLGIILTLILRNSA